MTRKTAAALAAAAVIAGGATVAPPAQAGQVGDAARAVVTAFYDQPASTRRNVCNTWKASPVRFGSKLARVLVRNGYSSRAASKGVAKGMVAVCGAPYGYGA